MINVIWGCTTTASFSIRRIFPYAKIQLSQKLKNVLLEKKGCSKSGSFPKRRALFHLRSLHTCIPYEIVIFVPNGLIFCIAKTCGEGRGEETWWLHTSTYLESIGLFLWKRPSQMTLLRQLNLVVSFSWFRIEYVKRQSGSSFEWLQLKSRFLQNSLLHLILIAAWDESLLTKQS